MESWAIDVLAYDGCFAAEAYGLVDLLGIANHVAGSLRPGAPPLFRTRIVSITGSVRPSGSGQLRTELVGPVPPKGELVVPGFMCVDPTTAVDRVTALPAEVGYLREVAGTRVSAICGGSFLLAAAGLLDGRTATTSWLFAPGARPALPVCQRAGDRVDRP